MSSPARAWNTTTLVAGRGGGGKEVGGASVRDGDLRDDPGADEDARPRERIREPIVAAVIVAFVTSI